MGSYSQHRDAFFARPVVGGNVVKGLPSRLVFHDHPVKTLVNPPESTGMGFWSINPYVGCEFGCTYCYARLAHHHVMERTDICGKPAAASWQEFEQQIFVKRRRTVLAALERDLGRVHTQARGQTQAIVLGTATDPYQPAERRFRITRAILQRLLDTRGLTLGVVTKSPLICRDIDLLSRLGLVHRVTVYMSLMSASVRVIKLFEARSPMPHARLRAVRRLRDAGIVAGINAAPVLPGITDSAFQIDALLAAARDAGAAFVHPSVIRLYPAVRDTFLPIITECFPNLVPRYRAAFQSSYDAPTSYTAAMQRRFRRCAHKYGLATNDPLHMRQRHQVRREIQLSLL